MTLTRRGEWLLAVLCGAAGVAFTYGLVLGAIRVVLAVAR